MPATGLQKPGVRWEAWTSSFEQEIITPRGFRVELTIITQGRRRSNPPQQKPGDRHRLGLSHQSRQSPHDPQALRRTPGCDNHACDRLRPPPHRSAPKPHPATVGSGLFQVDVRGTNRVPVHQAVQPDGRRGPDCAQLLADRAPCCEKSIVPLLVRRIGKDGFDRRQFRPGRSSSVPVPCALNEIDRRLFTGTAPGSRRSVRGGFRIGAG